MTKTETKQEMAELKQRIYQMWIDGERGNNETKRRQEERYALTQRWYDLRRQLR